MVSTQVFPVTVVGSWSRPAWLVQALRKRQAEELSSEEFNRIADEAVLAAVKYQEDAGVDIVTDGEMRRDNFYSFVVEKLSGMQLMKVSELPKAPLPCGRSGHGKAWHWMRWTF